MSASQTAGEQSERPRAQRLDQETVSDSLVSPSRLFSKRQTTPRTQATLTALPHTCGCANKVADLDVDRGFSTRSFPPRHLGFDLATQGGEGETERALAHL